MMMEPDSFKGGIFMASNVLPWKCTLELNALTVRLVFLFFFLDVNSVGGSTILRMGAVIATCGLHADMLMAFNGTQ